jgi:Fe(3+) dicitrate transport protein
MKKVLAAVMATIVTSIYAQQDTTSATKLEQVTIVGERAASIPGAGSYINKRTLEKLNQPNVNNVLRIIPGVNIRDEEGFGLRPNIGLRGTPVNRSAKITLMEDGILVAPAPYADPSAYYFPTFARMQGVEVLKGSSQIKYGPYTIGGAINLLSTAIPTSLKGFAQLTYGSFGTNQQRLWVGDSRKNIDYLVEVNRIASRGFKELNNGLHTGFDRRDVMGKLQWHTDDDHNLPQSVTLKLLSSSEIGKETYLGLTYQDYKLNPLRRYSGSQNDRLDLQHHHVSLTHHIDPTKNLSVNTTAYYGYTFREWDRANTFGGKGISSILADPTTNQAAYQIMTGQTNGAIETQATNRTYYSKGIQTNTQYIFTKKKIFHKIQLGIRYHRDQADRYATSGITAMSDGTVAQIVRGKRGNKENQIRNANSIATFLNYDLRVKNLKLSAGVRYEKIDFDFLNYGTTDNDRTGNALQSAKNEISVFLPGIGINYVLDTKMSVFGGVHKGFSPPGMPSPAITTRQAEVESSVNFELGYRYSSNRLRTQLVGFLNNYGNILGSDNVLGGGAGSGDMFNAGHAKIQGGELSINYDLLQKAGPNEDIKIPISLAYTYTEAAFRETFVNGGGDWGSGTIHQNDAIPFITPHLLTAGIGIENNRLNINFVTRYTGDTRIKPGQGEIVLPSENAKYNDVNAIGSFLIIDLSANYRFCKNFTVFSTINNVANNTAIVANLPQGYRPSQPRSYNIGLKANL